MTIEHDVISFLTTFFESNDCEVTELPDKGINIQLTEKLDRAIMNRPFYWHYVEATNQKGQPNELNFYTDIRAQANDREWIHFGTPRMNDICRYLETSNRFIRIFERVQVTKQTLLHPWLVLNVIISYKGKQLKEEILSIGLNLINGIVIEGMMESIQSMEFDSYISPHCYTVSPIIKITSGFKRIEQHIIKHLEGKNFAWVKESLLVLKEELLLLAHFYEDTLKKEWLIKEIIQQYSRLRPEVSFKVINGGLLYLATNVTESLI